ncbi:hypothetical protein ACFLYL_03975, partial [Chloroflexota bacterium]
IDNIIIAIGQAVDREKSFDGLEYTVRGTVSVDPVTLETGLKGIFAGGDMVTGPADIIGAIAAGKQAAVSIDRYISRQDLKQGRQAMPKRIVKRIELKSARPPLLSPDDRKTFAEVSLGFNDEMAVNLAGRCLNCGTTIPSVVFKRPDPKKKIVPWDADRALELWQKRHPDNGETLPDIFTDKSDVLQVPEGTYGRGELVLKPKTTEEKMFYTVDDE